MTPSDINSAQRGALIEAVAALYALDAREQDVLWVLDALSQQPSGPEAYAAMKRLFGAALTGALFEAVVMTLGGDAAPLFDDNREAYAEALREACFRVTELQTSVEGEFDAQRLRLEQDYVREWRCQYAGQLRSDAAAEAIEPLLERSPALIASIRMKRWDKEFHPRVQRLLVAHHFANQDRMALSLAQVADVVTPAQVLALAREGSVTGNFFDDVCEHYGAELVLDAYVEALFSPQSMLRQGEFGIFPDAVRLQGAALTDRFMARLPRTLEQGQWCLLTRNIMEPFKLVLSHLTEAEQVVQLFMGCRRGNLMSNSNRVLWRGHPTAEVQTHFKASPPAPGELGPTLAPLVQELNNGLTSERNISDIRIQSLLGMVHPQETTAVQDADALFTGGLLALLGDKRYDQDLLYPVDAHSCLMDHVPNLMAHMQEYCLLIKSKEPSKCRAEVAASLARLQARIDRNHERLMMSVAVPAGGRERTNAGDARCVEMEIL